MLILGAKGFAKELLEIFYQLGKLDDIYFYDNVSTNLPNLLFNKFPIIKSEKELEQYFTKKDKSFTLGIGGPFNRNKLALRMQRIGGNLVNVHSPKANIGHFDVIIEKGVTIMTGTVVTNNIIISEGVLLNLNCTIGHDSFLGEYVECSPGVHISGHCSIGSFTQIGTGAVVLPNINIGENCIIGAGSVINKDIPANSLVVGVPGKIIKTFAAKI